MKFAIISDTHDNIRNITKAFTWIKKQKIDLVLHCGDVCKRETIEEINNLFSGKMHYVRGNGDFYLDKNPEKLELEIDGKKIFMSHYPEISRQAAESGKYDLAFHGHTHKPWAEQIGKCILANPGELTVQRYQATFAIYDTQTNKLELKILERL